MKMRLKFASVVSDARKRLGYTQSEVAEAISVSVRWYQKIESGLKLPGTITAFRIVLFLHLDIEAFREEVGLVVPVSYVRREVTLR